MLVSASMQIYPRFCGNEVGGAVSRGTSILVLGLVSVDPGIGAGQYSE